MTGTGRTLFVGLLPDAFYPFYTLSPNSLLPSSPTEAARYKTAGAEMAVVGANLFWVQILNLIPRHVFRHGEHFHAL